MTTIAYKDGVIAYDSRVTAGGVIISDKFNKKFTLNSVVFFISGSVSDIDDIISLYPEKDIEKEISFSAFVVDGYGAWLYASDGDGIAFRMSLNGFSDDAIGSGCDHARTAMDCGLSARDAVKMAAKRDTMTGGRIRTYRIP